MEGVRQKCRPKHQVLILKCYPQYQKGVQDVKPNSSELSYLLYYTSTRRSKLTKVCSFLEKRAARDVWRRKIGNVQVTLQILSALIEKVPRDLPIYARSVMTVLETVLRSRDITLVEESIATFETFCQHQDMAALSAEQDFASQYREVVRTYASFADVDYSLSNHDPNPPLAIRWRNAGLRAIKGVISSDAGLAADGGDSLRIILPVILQNLYNGEDDLLVELDLKLQGAEKTEADPVHRRRQSTATVQTVDTVNGDPEVAAQTTADMDKKAETDVRLLALGCLERIVVTGSSRGQIHVTTKVVLEFILRKGRSESRGLSLDTKDTWETSLVELVAKWCPVQVRFIILASAMEILLDMKPKEETLDGAFTIIYMIDRLLKSPVNMIGLSVIDVLLGLMQYMSSLLSPSRADGASEKQNGHSDSMTELSARKLELLTLLQNSIGDLTTHIYYGDQVVDMIRAILTRIRPATAIEQPAVSTFATPSEALGVGAGSPGSPGASGESKSIAFSLPIAKVTALKAIKNILLVANSGRPAQAAGVDSRNQVGSYVWEGTQWLLREPDRSVRHAYADAFLAWLKLETNNNDLKIKEKTTRPTQSPKRDLSDVSDKPGKRAAGSNAAQRERAMIMAQSNFLRMLHLTIYDIALECPTEGPEITLLHLLLASLVEHLGVNAVRYGLPMILKLQEDMSAVGSLSSSAAQINIGSLVYGYLWALTERFSLDTYRVGNEIRNEIENRQRSGLWLDQIRVPPVKLDSISQERSAQTSGSVNGTNQFTPFGSSLEELVNRIEEAYNAFAISTTLSPPGSPGHNSAVPVLAHPASAASAPKGSLLSSLVKEQMLSGWSRESCLLAAEKEKSEAMSLSGSRAGTMAMRSHLYHNGTGASSHSTHSPASAHHGVSGAAAGLHTPRRTSVPNSSGSQINGSGREAPVHVNDLRRVLSVNTEGKDRRLSPLRGRLDTSDGSIGSSSSESMVSGYSLSEIDGEGGPSRPQSNKAFDGDGMETPKAFGTYNGDAGQSQHSLYNYGPGPDNIPPVPPIPPSLSIPGGFPNESQRSLQSAADRPSTAPGRPRRQSTTNGKAGSNATPSKSLSRHKSRSSTGLASAANDDEDISGVSRPDVQKLLDGFLSPQDAETRKSTRTRTGRRSATGGIGRPPY